MIHCTHKITKTKKNIINTGRAYKSTISRLHIAFIASKIITLKSFVGATDSFPLVILYPITFTTKDNFQENSQRLSIYRSSFGEAAVVDG